MATDYSQHMDVIGKQELGWVVPRVLEPGQTTTSPTGGTRSSTRTGSTGRPRRARRTRSRAATVNNGEAYVAKLPARRVIDPAKVAAGASPTHVWWSGSGNDFGCTPDKAHNLDVYLPELRDLPPGRR